jgi:peptidoglycan hydrolase CwlO-like protein
MNRKLLSAGGGATRHELIYGGAVLGVLAGAAISTWVWRQRVKAALNASPLQRADQMIDACEKKLEHIEKLMRELQEKT